MNAQTKKGPPLQAGRNLTRRRRRVNVPEADARWHLLVPLEVATNTRTSRGRSISWWRTSGFALRRRRRTVTCRRGPRSSGLPGQSIGICRRRSNGPPGERAVLFEIDVRRPSRRQLRVRGPNGVAWALFAPGSDGSWRARSDAAATGVAGGTTQTKFPEAGVWALVLFHDGRRTQGGQSKSHSVRGRSRRRRRSSPTHTSSAVSCSSPLGWLLPCIR